MKATDRAELLRILIESVASRLGVNDLRAYKNQT